MNRKLYLCYKTINLDKPHLRNINPITGLHSECLEDKTKEAQSVIQSLIRGIQQEGQDFKEDTSLAGPPAHPQALRLPSGTPRPPRECCRNDTASRQRRASEWEEGKN